MPDVILNALLLPVDALVLVAARRFGALLGLAIGVVGGGAAALCIAIPLTAHFEMHPRFGLLRLLAWCLFLHAPAVAAVDAWTHRARRPRALGGAGIALAIWLVGLDAFVVERFEIARIANAGKNPPASRLEAKGGVTPDPRRTAGNQDRASAVVR